MMVKLDVYGSVENFGVVSLMAFEGHWKPEFEFELELNFTPLNLLIKQVLGPNKAHQQVAKDGV